MTAAAPRTLVAMLQTLAADEPERAAVSYARDDGSGVDRVTYAELDARARAIAALLQARGAAGDRALLAFAPGLEFVKAFFGCLYAGWIAVPVPSGRGTERFERIQADAAPRLVLTAARPTRDEARADGASSPRLEVIATDEIGESGASLWRETSARESDVAFLQYTSGSTAAPRGVIVSHANALHNARGIGRRFGMSRDSSGVSWLPHFHDMGLVGGILVPLVTASHVTLLSALAVARRPLRWLEVISRERGTVSGGPNFVFDLCVDRTTLAEREALDLSCWEVAFVGAEPVRAATLGRFADAFAESGFRRNALYPCYGLAEATLMVSGGERLAGPRVSDDNAVGCGHAVDGLRVRVVDPATGAERADGEIGEIAVAGPSVTRGYWGSGAATPGREQSLDVDEHAGEPTRGPAALRTGDLGFVTPTGELFITGRLKAVIVHNGRKIHAEDIERTVLATEHVSGGVAAVAIDANNTEELAVFAEISQRVPPEEREHVAHAVRLAVAVEHQLPLAHLVLVKSGRLPRTTSGKVRRDACRAAYIDGVLPTLLVSR